MRISPRSNSDTKKKIKKILQIPADQRNFKAMMESKSRAPMLHLFNSSVFVLVILSFLLYVDQEALLRARAQRLEKLKAKRGEYDAEARKEGHDPHCVPPQILNPLQLPLLHQRIRSLFPQQTKKPSLWERGLQRRPPKSPSPKNLGLLSPQNLPNSRATKKTLAKSL